MTRPAGAHGGREAVAVEEELDVDTACEVCGDYGGCRFMISCDTPGCPNGRHQYCFISPLVASRDADQLDFTFYCHGCQAGHTRGTARATAAQAAEFEYNTRDQLPPAKRQRVAAGAASGGQGGVAEPASGKEAAPTAVKPGRPEQSAAQLPRTQPAANAQRAHAGPKQPDRKQPPQQQAAAASRGGAHGTSAGPSGPALQASSKRSEGQAAAVAGPSSAAAAAAAAARLKGGKAPAAANAAAAKAADFSWVDELNSPAAGGKTAGGGSAGGAAVQGASARAATGPGAAASLPLHASSRPAPNLPNRQAQPGGGGPAFATLPPKSRGGFNRVQPSRAGALVGGRLSSLVGGVAHKQQSQQQQQQNQMQQPSALAGAAPGVPPSQADALRSARSLRTVWSGRLVIAADKSCDCDKTLELKAQYMQEAGRPALHPRLLSLFRAAPSELRAQRFSIRVQFPDIMRRAWDQYRSRPPLEHECLQLARRSWLAQSTLVDDVVQSMLESDLYLYVQLHVPEDGSSRDLYIMPSRTPAGDGSFFVLNFTPSHLTEDPDVRWDLPAEAVAVTHMYDRSKAPVRGLLKRVSGVSDAAPSGSGRRITWSAEVMEQEAALLQTQASKALKSRDAQMERHAKQVAAEAAAMTSAQSGGRSEAAADEEEDRVGGGEPEGGADDGGGGSGEGQAAYMMAATLPPPPVGGLLPSMLYSPTSSPQRDTVGGTTTPATGFPPTGFPPPYVPQPVSPDEDAVMAEAAPSAAAGWPAPASTAAYFNHPQQLHGAAGAAHAEEADRRLLHDDHAEPGADGAQETPRAAAVDDDHRDDDDSYDADYDEAALDAAGPIDLDDLASTSVLAHARRLVRGLRRLASRPLAELHVVLLGSSGSEPALRRVCRELTVLRHHTQAHPDPGSVDVVLVSERQLAEDPPRWPEYFSGVRSLLLRPALFLKYDGRDGCVRSLVQQPQLAPQLAQAHGWLPVGVVVVMDGAALQATGDEQLATLLQLLQLGRERCAPPLLSQAAGAAAGAAAAAAAAAPAWTLKARGEHLAACIASPDKPSLRLGHRHGLVAPLADVERSPAPQAWRDARRVLAANKHAMRFAIVAHADEQGDQQQLQQLPDVLHSDVRGAIAFLAHLLHGATAGRPLPPSSA